MKDLIRDLIEIVSIGLGDEDLDVIQGAANTLLMAT